MRTGVRDESGRVSAARETGGVWMTHRARGHGACVRACGRASSGPGLAVGGRWMIMHMKESGAASAYILYMTRWGEEK